jgi:signal transduction histidine kinase
LGAVARQVVSGLRERRQRAEQLSTLGRYSSQMAHDLRNPLAALRGAAEFLFEELERGRPIDQHKDFVRLMLDQVDRVTGVIDEYQRLGRMDPVREPLALNEVVKAVLALQGFAGKGVQVKSQLAADLPPCPIDRHLLSGMLENLMRNAFEAMGESGTLTVRTERGQHGGRDGVVVEVGDTGPGMDARTRERAFDEFYTTKATGSGLGLAFVRRAVEAHGGSVSLETRAGHGCRFRLFFPAA